MIGICRATIASEFAVNFRAAFFRMLVFLEHHDTRAFAHDKAVAVLVKRTAGLLRIVIAAAEGLHRSEARDAERSDCGFCTTSDESIRIAEFDDAPRLAKRVVRRRTGSDDTHVRPAQVVFHRHHAAGHVRNHHGNRERRHTRRTAISQAVRFLLHAVETANTAADHHAKARAVHSLEVDTGVFEGHLGPGHGKLREAVRALHGLGIFEILHRLEVLHFAGNLAVVGRRIEGLKKPNATASFDKGFPECFQIASNRAYNAHAGHDDSSFAHVLKNVRGRLGCASFTCADAPARWQ